MATWRIHFWHYGQDYCFFRMMFFLIWIKYHICHLYAQSLDSSYQFFILFHKITFFTDPHHATEKQSVITESLTDLKKITFVIRITFFKKLGGPEMNRRTWPCTAYPGLQFLQNYLKDQKLKEWRKMQHMQNYLCHKKYIWTWFHLDTIGI